MNFYNSFFMFFNLMFIFNFCCLSSGQSQRVEIPGSRILTVTSPEGQEYSLYISLPNEYENNTRKFPVVYLLDGQWDFPLVYAIYGQQYYDRFLPEIIIVGITWGGKSPDYDRLRAKDLTPSDTSGISLYGNAPKFLSSIKNNIIPLIESKFRTKKNDRTLMGSSFGGLFTLYALFNETGLFNRYIAASPAVNWDNEIIFNYEKKYAEKNSELPVRIYMAIGEYENISYFQKFTEQINKHYYKGLEFRTKTIEGAGHSGTKAEGFTRGLQFVFRNYQ